MATVPELVAFGALAAVTLASSAGAVLMRDVWHASLLLGVSLFSIAAHFVLLNAEFLAAMQVLVYVGGVLVLITFAVMLTRGDEDLDPGDADAGDRDRPGPARADGGRPAGDGDVPDGSADPARDRDGNRDRPTTGGEATGDEAPGGDGTGGDAPGGEAAGGGDGS